MRQEHFVRFGAVFSILIVTFIGTLSATAAHAQGIPTYQQFVSSLPKYSYECDVQKFFADPKFQKAMGVAEVPSNADFNAELADIVPGVLYNSISRLAVLNPEYAEQLFRNARHLKLRLICTKFGAAESVEASTRYHFLAFGEKTINIEVLVLSLLDKHYSLGKVALHLPEINKPDNAASLTPTLYRLPNPSNFQLQNYLNLEENLSFRITLFHEFLHADSLQSGFLSHASDAVITGGDHDIVYACSQYSWRPTDQVAHQNYTVYDNFKRFKVEAYSDSVYHFYFSGYHFAFPHHPQSLLLHTFTYNKCMTCALARVYGNTYHEATDKFSIVNAEQTCSEIAPKIDLPKSF